MDTSLNLNQFKQWLLETYTHNHLADIANHGANCGWHAITYYSETDALYEQFKAAIWELLVTDMLELGYQSVPELIATFALAKDIDSDLQLRNLLVWYAVEKLAHEITDGDYVPYDEQPTN